MNTQKPIECFIWKFGLAYQNQEIECSRVIKPLTFQLQHGIPCIWLLLEGEEIFKYRVIILGTGHKIPVLALDSAFYIGTIQTPQGLVWHAFIEQIFNVNEEQTS